MNKISERRVSVTRYDKMVSIMLAWREGEQDGESHEKDKFIRFQNAGIPKKLEIALNKLVDSWAHVFLSGFDMQMVSDEIVKGADEFDMIAESDHAEDTLLSL